MNTDLLEMKVLSRPDKELYKTIQSNAKFKSLDDIVRTKVGINNFYHFSIAFKSTILFRDIVLNCPFVSGWARSSQVLNNSDSKFDGYKFYHLDETGTKQHIDMLKSMENKNYSMDNIRCLIPLGTITDYAISIDLLTLVYLYNSLNITKSKFDITTNSQLMSEIDYFRIAIGALLDEYVTDIGAYANMLNDANYAFNTIYSPINAFKDTTKEKCYKLDTTYSVVGQLFRHRTLYKRYNASDYHELLIESQAKTKDYDYNAIEVNPEITGLIKNETKNANNIYKLVQGSIIPILITGTTGAIYKALCQRACFINDTPQFEDVFRQFAAEHEDDNLSIKPPCKFNGRTCYVGYVNNSRLKGEEKTQIPCPVWCKANGYIEAYKDALSSDKTQWYIDNLDGWGQLK